MTRKLIEVALPLEAISAASRRDKDRKTGSIKNVHKWFAPMPTPAWRALLFAAIVNDPGEGPARDELLDLTSRLVPEDGTAPSIDVLHEARDVLAAQGGVPTVFDPFCGGGSTVIEALRLGLPAVGSDLNPVPVLITKVLTELLPRAVGSTPLWVEHTLAGTTGALEAFLADVRHYAEQVADEARGIIGDYYPAPEGGGKVLSWLWARTARCPNPACGSAMPLYSSPWLSKRKGEERWLQPIIDGNVVSFRIGTGKVTPPPGTKIGRGAKFRCIVCGEVAPEAHIKAEGVAGRMGCQMLAMYVVRPDGKKEFAVASAGQVESATLERPVDVPDDVLQPDYARWFSSPAFGMVSQADLFTNRQLHAMTVFSDMVAMVPDWVGADGGDPEYAHAIAAVLGLCVGKLAMSNSMQSRWYIDSRNGSGQPLPAFGRHALPMVWDFAEANPFGGSVGDWVGQLKSIELGIRTLPLEGTTAKVVQADARSASDLLEPHTALVATDPPYFSHIGYADLSDFFYVWHRRALRSVFPELYGTMSTPKSSELIAAVYRHDGDQKAAEHYFVEGYTKVFSGLLEAQRPDLPMIVVYAHRQEEGDGDELGSTGWDAMLEALLAGGLGVVGTWPIHATHSSRQIGQGTNSLASYIVLVCRPRDVETGITDRQGFVRALRKELPDAVRALQAADTLPFDMTQAVVGPGMAIYSRFSRVVEPDGEPMRVKAAIALINQVRSAVLSEQDDEFDADTRWAIQWFERFAFDQGPFGEAEKLFTATATSLEGLKRTGIVASKAPNVWLIEPESLPADWDPITDMKTCTWEVTMHLLRALHHAGGEAEAAQILAKVDRFGDLARDLAYRLADICEATKRASTALAVNGLIASWPEISRLASSTPLPSQESLL